MRVSAVRRPALLVLVLVGLFTAPGEGRDQRNFWVLNNTQKKITRLYVSPTDSKSWGQDVLGDDTDLPHATGALVVFTPDVPSACTMDFRIVFSDGTRKDYQRATDVCTVSAVQFDADGLTLLREK